MERGSLDKLKYDIRLARRRDWIDAGEASGYIDSLPDVADKSIRGDQDPEEAKASSAEPGAPEIPASEPAASAAPEPWGAPRDEA